MSHHRQFVICYVALGSNLGDSLAYINNGIQTLSEYAAIKGLLASSLYRSKPHGPQDQPDYINAAVVFETTLKAEPLLDVLQDIENKNERVRQGVERWGARTLDLDLLLYGDEHIASKRLSVPHPRICERPFVLYPLRDLLAKKTSQTLLQTTEADLKISATASLKECIAGLSPQAKNEINKL